MYYLKTTFYFRQFYLCVCLCLTAFAVNAQTGDDSSAGKYNGVWAIYNDVLTANSNPGVLGGGQIPASRIKDYIKGVKGVFTTFTWSSIKPTYLGGYNWNDVDDSLATYTAAGFYIILMIWTGMIVPLAFSFTLYRNKSKHRRPESQCVSLLLSY